MGKVAVKERGILFKGHLVRAILDGRKTQTRRVMRGIANPELADRYIPAADGSASIKFLHDLGPGVAMAVSDWLRCPYGVPGNRLYVRETWARHYNADQDWWTKKVVYRADYPNGISDTHDYGLFHWRPSIHMPRSASRITLEITDVRVERIQDIQPADVAAEGIAIEPCDHSRLSCEDVGCLGPERASFAEGWDKINAKRGFGWQANPWCWAISFRRLEVNDDEH